jgi:DNA replicative helicase MCM subunit Mcm2 (Cdc46/Mcm family)
MVRAPKIEYGKPYGPKDRKWVTRVDGFKISSDKHAYVCETCGAVFQSKNIHRRSLFRTDDPRCIECEKNCRGALKRVCECPPIVF